MTLSTYDTSMETYGDDNPSSAPLQAWGKQVSEALNTLVGMPDAAVLLRGPDGVRGQDYGGNPIGGGHLYTSTVITQQIDSFTDEMVPVRNTAIGVYGVPRSSLGVPAQAITHTSGTLAVDCAGGDAIANVTVSGSISGVTVSSLPVGRTLRLNLLGDGGSTDYTAVLSGFTNAGGSPHGTATIHPDTVIQMEATYLGGTMWGIYHEYRAGTAP